MEIPVILLVTTKMEKKFLDIDKNRVQMAEQLIAKYAPGYKMVFNKRLEKSRARCVYKKHQIEINPYTFAFVRDDDAFVTVMHEIAHTQTVGAHHNFVFRAKLRELLKLEGHTNLANRDDKYMHFAFDNIRILAGKIMEYDNQRGRYIHHGNLQDYYFPSQIFTYSMYENTRIVMENPLLNITARGGVTVQKTMAENTHTPASRFACDFAGCGKDYANAGALYNHKKRKNHFKGVN